MTSQEDTSFPHFFLTIVVVLYYFTTTKKKEGETGHALNILPDRSSSDHVTNVTSGQKAPLGRILRNFRLSMRRTYFRSLPDRASSGLVTSGHVTSGEKDNFC